MSHSRSRSNRKQQQHHDEGNQGEKSRNRGEQTFRSQGEHSGQNFGPDWEQRVQDEQQNYAAEDYGESERFGRQGGYGGQGGYEQIHYGRGNYGGESTQRPSEFQPWQRSGRQDWRSREYGQNSGNREWVSGVGQKEYRGDQTDRFSNQSSDRGIGRDAGMGRSGGQAGQQSDVTRSGSRRDYGQSPGSSSTRQSFAGVGPQGYRRSDERITEDINEELTQDEDLDASNITVEVKNGEVVLKGFVPNRESKRRAEEIAEARSGVQDVQNQIRVKREGSSDFERESKRNRTDDNEKSAEKQSSRIAR